MARTVAVIQKQILDTAYNSYGTNSNDPLYKIFHDASNNLIVPSATNKFVLITFLVAGAIAIFEQLQDLFKTNLETEISAAPAGSNLWLQNQVLNIFQYSSTNPQIIQLINYTPSYPVLNESLRLITQCAVVNDNDNGGYSIKIAKGGSSPTPISSTELNALGSFLNQINFGVPYTIVNSNPDLLMIGVDIYYDGQYSSVIQQSVTDAINTYIAGFTEQNNFNGNVLMSKIEDVIQSVPGVEDVLLKQVEATPDGASVVVLVDNAHEIYVEYATQAGYIIIDTNTGRTLADTLTFIIQ